MKQFEVVFYDCRRFKRVMYVEAANAKTLELGLAGALGMAGCEILLPITEANPDGEPDLERRK